MRRIDWRFIATMLWLYSVICSMCNITTLAASAFNGRSSQQATLDAVLFVSGWFVFGLLGWTLLRK